MKKFPVILLGFLFCIHTGAFCQDTDSVKVLPDSNQTIRKFDKEKFQNLSKEDIQQPKKHSPFKAGLYSAILPGAGQVYNKKYWKIPIIYGLGGVLMYQMLDLNKSYKEYTCAYENALEGLDYTSCLNIKSEQLEQLQSNKDPVGTLQTEKDNFRKNRDMFILYTSLVYVLNIVDAVVDAHLWEFDVTDDLSLASKPQFYLGQNRYYFGGQISLNFK